jgi:hypothetical protein
MRAFRAPENEMLRLTIWFVIVLSVLCAGCWYSKAQDADSMAYVKSAVSAIATSWQCDELHKRASPEFLAVTSRKKLGRICNFAQHNLGNLTNYESANGSATFFVPPRNGVSEVAQYEVNASFKKGDGKIEITAAKRSDGWKLDMIYVRVTS